MATEEGGGARACLSVLSCTSRAGHVYTCALSLCRALPVLLCVWWNTHTQTSRLAHFTSNPLRRSRLSAPPSSPSHRHGTLRETRERRTLSRGSLSRKKKRKERMRASWPSALEPVGARPSRSPAVRPPCRCSNWLPAPIASLPTWSPTPLFLHPRCRGGPQGLRCLDRPKGSRLLEPCDVDAAP